MGSLITLGINKFEIDWGKNECFNNHSKLFNRNDIHDEYYYYANNQKEKKSAYSAQLLKVKLRLELLGYTLKTAKKSYAERSNWYKEYYSQEPLLSFNQFYLLLKSLDLYRVKFTEEEAEGGGDYDLGEYFRRCVKEKLGAKNNEICDSLDEQFFEHMDPWTILCLLAQNEQNLHQKVIWRFKDSVDAGYVGVNDVYEELATKDKYLIITEGTSDLFVIKKSIELLYPEIFDFFYYIDMEKNYPFTGCGSLLNFVKGLSKINPLNKILVIFDNDADGIDKFRQCENLSLPQNLGVMKLPYLKELERFDTIGPTGVKKMNINGLASSIECFLDIGYKTVKKPRIRWSSYIRNSNYQGALENKENYTKIFEQLKRTDEGYNFSKLKKLINDIIDNCLKIVNKQKIQSSMG